MIPAARWRHRIWQALGAPSQPDPAQELEVSARLGPHAHLFMQMTPYDRAHALRVYREVLRLAPGDEELAEAALLHDCGKAGMGPGLGLRAVAVLAGAGWMREILQAAPGGERLRGYLEHEGRGLELMRQAGVREGVCAIVAAMAGPDRAAPELRERARILSEVDDRV